MGKQTVAFTFDDGPGTCTAPILDLLAKAGSHATFFVLGRHILGNQKLLLRTRDEGHEIGLHGWDHCKLENLKTADLRGQVKLCENALAKAANVRARRWRSPWGVTPDWAREILLPKFEIIGVGIDTYDCNRSANDIVKAVRGTAVEYSIVTMHDGVSPNGNERTKSRAETVKAVERLLKDYRSVRVGDLPDLG